MRKGVSILHESTHPSPAIARSPLDDETSSPFCKDSTVEPRPLNIPWSALMKDSEPSTLCLQTTSTPRATGILHQPTPQDASTH